MDDLARGVGMGKGTLYKYFPSKEILLMNTIDFFASRMERLIEEVIKDEQLTAIEKLSKLLKTVAEKLAKINPASLAYLERSMPEVYEKLEKTRERMVVTNFIKVLEDGKKSGVFTPEMDPFLFAHIIIGAISHVTQAKVLENMNYSLDQIFTSTISLLFQGCLTEEGRKLAYPDILHTS
jgi:AcrR family transcriptional regulator